MTPIILGTAGHIDHGKTSLVKAISGIDTDRLKEEKERGITIELGFAYIDLPSGQRLGIVDVPGHEKFVKNMVAGATGIDIVAMVIAADEGIMPQTREHIEICSLLNIRYGIVVLTKTDMVEEDWLEMVTEDVKGFMTGTFLEGAPILPVSSTTGRGISELIQTLDDLCAQIPSRSLSSLFRLPVDRVFTMKGFGTVITGTLISGLVRVGDTIMIYPSEITSKVRGIQVHGESVHEASAGMRTAINFQGLEKTSVNRGDVLSIPGALIPSFMIDVSFHYLSGNKKSLKNRSQVRFHAGTAEILGNLILLDREEVEPGETVIAQMRLDAPITVVKDDRFVIRSYSPVRTIGGGGVINPIPQKHKRFKPEIIEGLKRISEEDIDELVSYHIEQAGYRGLVFSELKIMTNVSEKHLLNTLQKLMSERIIIQMDKETSAYIHQHVLESLLNEAVDSLKQYHHINPLKAGMPKEELKSKFSFISPKLFNLMLNRMIKEQKIVQEEETVRLSGHQVLLAADQAGMKVKILETYQNSGLEPPYFKELAEQPGMNAELAKNVLQLLVDEGHLIKVKEDLYFHAEAVANLKQKTVAFLTTHGEMNTPQFKSIANVSRKYLIPLIEYFDSKNVTIRVGDIRKLRKG